MNSFTIDLARDLSAARVERRIVRVFFDDEKSYSTGYILDVDQKWFSMQCVSFGETTLIATDKLEEVTMVQIEGEDLEVEHFLFNESGEKITKFSANLRDFLSEAMAGDNVVFITDAEGLDAIGIVRSLFDDSVEIEEFSELGYSDGRQLIRLDVVESAHFGGTKGRYWDRRISRRSATP